MDKKSADWAIVSLVNEDKIESLEVSINKTSKKGEVFPNFDKLAVGQEIEGELWQSTVGKEYLFPPRVAKAGQGGTYKGQVGRVVKEAQERKEASISLSQDRKEWGIKVSSTFGKACEFAVAEWQEQKKVDPTFSATLEKLFEKWREYLWMNYDVGETQYPPFK